MDIINHQLVPGFSPTEAQVLLTLITKEQR